MSMPGPRIASFGPLPNTFGIRATVDRLFEVDDVDALPQVLAQAGRDALIVGSGSNLLPVAEQIDCVVQPSDARIELIEANTDDVLIRVSAGCIWHALVMHSIAQGWFGLENLALIPGTVGAAPIQNIGAYGVEVMDLIESVQVHDRHSGETRWWPHDECGFSYRDSAFKADPQRHAVLRVDFRLSRTPKLTLNYAGIGDELAAAGINTPTARDVANAVIALRRRKLPDPAVTGNAGSFFKNPIVDLAQVSKLQSDHPTLPIFPSGDPATRKLSAAWLIDQCGWKGAREGDAGVSPGHALVLVNHGAARGADILQLARRVAESVQQRFGVAIEPEPRLIGAHW
ncbi:MAG: UDP-N-acetylmuramate dehydrogenase [Pseudomonadota bacterium]|nr:UDP-N-acetylmuramate dehydrogenase [Pseudomonadota bacterium]